MRHDRSMPSGGYRRPRSARGRVRRLISASHQPGDGREPGARCERAAIRAWGHRERRGRCRARLPIEPTAPAVNPPAGGAADLEALLPSQVGGVRLQKASFAGTGFAFDAGAPFDSSALEPLLKANGKTIADVRMAVARPVGAKPGALGTMLMALQVKGIDAAKVVDVVGASSSMTPTVVGGKQVLQVGTTGFNLFVYTKDDILFEVVLTNAGDAPAVLAALP